MPPQIGRLTSLPRLPRFVVHREKERGIAESKEFTNIQGDLLIENLENVAGSDDAQQANFKNKPLIDHLSLLWSEDHDQSSRDEQVEEEVAEGLQPHPNLKILEIYYYRCTHFPSWMMKMDMLMLLPNLQVVLQYDCQRCNILPPLGFLPSLSDLYIHKMEQLKKIGHEFCGTAGGLLSSVKELRLGDLGNLEEWRDLSVGEANFPHLQKLNISHCPKMRRWLNIIPVLTKLDVSDGEGFDELSLLLPSLSVLYMGGLGSERLLKSVPCCCTSLSLLEICRIPSLNSMPPGMLEVLIQLKDLKIQKCEELLVTLLEEEKCGSQQQQQLQDEGLPSTLTSLLLTDCNNLISLPRETALISHPYQRKGFRVHFKDCRYMVVPH
ncbi:hypothetical protein ACLOJK_038864 [Asimina triloba]